MLAAAADLLRRRDRRLRLADREPDGHRRRRPGQRCRRGRARSSTRGSGSRPSSSTSAASSSKPIVDILARNSRTPELTVADTLALAAATRAAEQRVIELCERFGVETVPPHVRALLERTRTRLKVMLDTFIPEEPLVFEDVIDDDGRGNGPFTIRLALWREDGKAILDFARHVAAGGGPDQPLHGREHVQDGQRDRPDHGARSADPLQPRLQRPARDPLPAGLDHPARLSGTALEPVAYARSHLRRALGRAREPAPEPATGAACGSSPHFLYSGFDADGEFFFFYEINYGGNSRAADRRRDGRPRVVAARDLDSGGVRRGYFPLRIERLRGVARLGRAGSTAAATGSRRSIRSSRPARSRSTTTASARSRGGSAAGLPRRARGRCSFAGTATEGAPVEVRLPPRRARRPAPLHDGGRRRLGRPARARPEGRAQDVTGRLVRPSSLASATASSSTVPTSIRGDCAPSWRAGYRERERCRSSTSAISC